MSSVEAAEAAKVNGFQKQVLPLPVVEMELLLFYNYYCNNFSAFGRYACFRNTSKNDRDFSKKLAKVHHNFGVPQF